MRNVYTYQNELTSVDGEEIPRGLHVTQVETKSLDDIKRVINNGKVKAVDKFISLYLPTLDPEQLAADSWYQQHLLVESADPDEVKKVVYSIGDDGQETPEILPNTYEVALQERTALEHVHAWLKGLRGLDAPERPPFEVSVDQWKEDNTHLFQSYNKQVGVEINGVKVSLTEEQQNGIAAVQKGIELAEKYQQDIFPINFKARTFDGEQVIAFEDQAAFEMFALQFMAARQTFF